MTCDALVAALVLSGQANMAICRERSKGCSRHLSISAAPHMGRQLRTTPGLEQLASLQTGASCAMAPRPSGSITEPCTCDSDDSSNAAATHLQLLQGLGTVAKAVMAPPQLHSVYEALWGDLGCTLKAC